YLFDRPSVSYSQRQNGVESYSRDKGDRQFTNSYSNANLFSDTNTHTFIHANPTRHASHYGCRWCVGSFRPINYLSSCRHAGNHFTRLCRSTMCGGSFFIEELLSADVRH